MDFNSFQLNLLTHLVNCWWMIQIPILFCYYKYHSNENTSSSVFPQYSSEMPIRRIMKSEDTDILEALDTKFAQLPSREADNFTLLPSECNSFLLPGTCKSCWSPHSSQGLPARCLTLTCGQCLPLGTLGLLLICVGLPLLCARPSLPHWPGQYSPAPPPCVQPPPISVLTAEWWCHFSQCGPAG